MRRYAFIILIFTGSFQPGFGFKNTDQKIDDFRYRVAKKVFDDLVEAKGVKNMPIPDFVLSRSERNIAWSDYKKTEIGLEAKAYEVCRTFGKDSLNAIAAILSHELTHYYEKHGWTELFVAHYEDIEANEQLMHTSDMLSKELQADYLGGFLAAAAGYRTLLIMPDFLERVYRAYGLPADLPGYPSLDDRKKTAEISLNKCKKLIDVFDGANHLVSLGKYSEAQVAFKYILKDFQSRELYNNLGVIALSSFMTMVSTKEYNFIFPFELDGLSRLNNDKRGGNEDFAKMQIKKSELLEEAIGLFKTAISLDENYSPAYLNLACAYALKEAYEDADYFAKKSIKIAGDKNKSISDAYVLLGIIACKSNDLSSGKNYFEKAIKLNNIIASTNFEILNNKEIRSEKITLENQAKVTEMIEKLSLHKLANDLERERFEPDYSIELDKDHIFAVKEMDHSVIYIHLQPWSSKYTIIHCTKKSYKDTCSKGIGIGDPLEKVKALYGDPDTRLNRTQSEVFIYYPSTNFFIFNSGNSLESFGVYKIK